VTSWALLVPSVALYFLLVPLLARYLTTEHQRISISFPASKNVLKAVSLDQGLLIGEYMVIKVITFFGGRSTAESKPLTKGDYFVMYRNLDVATALDPYNIDAYYFAQATFSWEVGEFAGTNQLLEYGMKYRTWDHYLPYFIGFNYSYFMKDPINAARYYKKAAEISGEGFFMSLAGRYLYEGGQTEEAMAYSKIMIDSTKNESIRLFLKKRYTALAAVRKIEQARELYRSQTGGLPLTINQLTASGALKELPVDPYGGTFFIDPKGQVRTTSNFAEVKAQKQAVPEQK
jgi:tetratricopeptide (TPR) repeat protein